MSSDTANLDPDIAEALANAERRRGMLQQLAQFGMHLAMQIDAHAAAAMAAIYEPKTGDPARSFATISRTVRLTLAMEARADAQVFALRKGRLPAGWGMSVQAPPSQCRPCEDTRHRAPGDALRPARESLVDRETWDEELRWLSSAFPRAEFLPEVPARPGSGRTAGAPAGPIRAAAQVRARLAGEGAGGPDLLRPSG